VGNNIGDEGAKAIAEALKVNQTLTQINLCILINLIFTIFTKNRGK